MGLGSFLDKLGDDGEHLLHSGEKAAGSFVDADAHAVGGALDMVGLHGAAKKVDGWGDTAADHLGATVAEQQLGQSDDPKDLIHGDCSAIEERAEKLETFAAAFAETGDGLTRLDSAHWQGKAADAFRAKFAAQTKAWLTAAEAMESAARTLRDFSRIVSWAQGQAEQAIHLYARGQAATKAADDRYNAQVAAYNQAAHAYNAAVRAGTPPATEPVQPTRGADPGTADRERAQQILADARRERDRLGGQAAAELARATALAPAEPSFTRRLGMDARDAFKDGQVEKLHFAGGLLKGADTMVDFVRGLNPYDPYNITHPAQYTTQVSSTAAGLVHAANNPTDLFKSILGSGWGSDPSEALGKLTVNLAAGAVTDGGADAAVAGEAVTEDAAKSVALDSAESTAIETATATTDTGLTQAEHLLDQFDLSLDPPPDYNLPDWYKAPAEAPAALAQAEASIAAEEEALRRFADGALDFTDNGAAAKYGADEWNAYVDDLSEAEKKAVNGYTHESIGQSGGVPTYKELNPYLRAGQLGTDAVLDESIRQIDKALAGHVVPKDILVNRGTDIGHLSLHDPKQLLTMVVEEQSFTSTSLGDAAFGGYKAAVLHLRVPAGTPALWVEKLSAYASERELLLGRGLKWKADVVRQGTDGKLHIYARVVR